MFRGIRALPGPLAVAFGLAAFGLAAEETIDVEDGITLTPAAGWARSPDPIRNAVVLVTAAKAGARARLVVTVEHRLDHEEAVRRLQRIEHVALSYQRRLKEPQEPRNVAGGAGCRPEVIAGWPAVVCRYRVPVVPTGQGEQRGEREGAQRTMPRITVAIAAGTSLVRLDGTLLSGPDPRLAEDVLGMARALRFARPGSEEDAQRALDGLRATPPPSEPEPAPSRPAPSRTMPAPVAARRSPSSSVQSTTNVGNSFGELEVAARAGTSGPATMGGFVTVVVATPNTIFTSLDSGKTFTNQGFPFTWSTDPFSRGDPSIAVGANGRFFVEYIGIPDGSAAAKNKKGCATEISSSADGLGFSFLNHAVLCPLKGVTVTVAGYPFTETCFPDQEHVAADTRHEVGGKSQVYSVWRHFTSLFDSQCTDLHSGSPDPAIVCSKDGGATWTQPMIVGSGDYARVAVGRDGAVYVLYRDGDDLMLNKLSSCDNGLNQKSGFPVDLADVEDPECPIAGLDRCHEGLSSHTVAPDPDDAEHVTVAYAYSTSSSNDNIKTKESYDGGETWSSASVVNKTTSARRFMPWTCAMSGWPVIVGWYDRRAASSEANDLTDYFAGTVTGVEWELSKSPDPQCASEWTAATREEDDSETCTSQPQKAGRCGSATGSTKCDFSSSGCSCETGDGQPKYGDYNGIACAEDMIFAAWATATPQGGAAPPSGINVFMRTVTPPRLDVTLVAPSGLADWFTVSAGAANWVQNRGPGPIFVGAVMPLGTSKVDVGSTPSLPPFTTSFSGDCDASGNVTLGFGDWKSCTVTAKFEDGADSAVCENQCTQDRNDCLSHVTDDGGTLAKDCVQQYNACKAKCAHP